MSFFIGVVVGVLIAMVWGTQKIKEVISNLLIKAVSNSNGNSSNDKNNGK